MTKPKHSISPSRRTLAVVLFAVVALVPAVADAEPADEAPRGDRSAPAPFAIDGWFGIGRRDDVDGESAVGSVAASLLYRPSWLTLGVTAEHDGEINPFGGGGGTHEFFGVLGGHTLTLTRWFAVETLAELGVHVTPDGDTYHVPETDEVVRDETSAVAPYAGLRIAPTFTFGDFRVGPWLSAREDLGRGTAFYTSTDCSAGDCSSTRASHDVGGFELSGGLRAGIALGR